jgi:preprotein translocase subunit SecE
VNLKWFVEVMYGVVVVLLCLLAFYLLAWLWDQLIFLR